MLVSHTRSRTASPLKKDTFGDSTQPRKYLNEMLINFKIIENRWIKRRQEQANLLSAINSSKITNDGDDNSDIIYPFTYMIDCLLEECKSYATVAQLFLPSQSPDQENFLRCGYPPKSLIVNKIQ